MTIKHLTILHSNDMHGEFLPKMVNGKEVGGIARLSGYVNKVRKENHRVMYAIAGDMFRGSIIDSEYLGLSTINLMNNLRPDVACLGNHEVDYGLAHLLFLEKCARFPIVNADFYITMNNARLFTPYINLRFGNLRVLVIGILTNEVLSVTKNDTIIGSFVDIKAAAKEVSLICDNYRTTKTDLTILLTHLGVEADKELAASLDPEWGVDLIIGGHSHTFMEEPVIVNGIPIVQAGTGTGQIGEAHLTVDTDTKEIVDFNWKCVEINEDTCDVDPVLETLVDCYRSETDTKYKRVITRFTRQLTHPARNQETELGNLYADIMQWESSFDIMMFGSGSIRKKEMGPIVEYQDMLEMTPYDDKLWMFEVTGEQFKRIVLHVCRDEAWAGHTEFYQFSKGVRIKYNKTTHELEEFKFNGQDIMPQQHLKIAIQNYHYNNFEEFLGISLKEVKANAKPVSVASSILNIIEEYFSTHDMLDSCVEGRLEVVD